MMNRGYGRQIVPALGGRGSRASQSLPQVFDLGHTGFRALTGARAAALLAFLLAGCGTGIPEQLPAPAIPEVQVGIVANRYLLGAALEAARYFHEDAPRTPDGLLAHHSDPAGGRIWADALFMVAPLMAKAGTVLDDQSYYDDVLAQFRGFSERLRDPEVGLYHQGWGWDGPGASPGYWGRANGWVALAMTEVLDTLPVDYPGRDELLTSYREFTAAIVDHQGIGGMWHQLLNRYDPDSYEETSSTAMFIYAMTKGIRRGWLDDGYVGGVERAHRGLSRKISLAGNIAGISPGCSTKSSEEGYLDKGPRTNDPHGIGPVLLALYGVMSLSES